MFLAGHSHIYGHRDIGAFAGGLGGGAVIAGGVLLDDFDYAVGQGIAGIANHFKWEGGWKLQILIKGGTYHGIEILMAK